MKRELSPPALIAIAAVAVCLLVVGWLWYSGTFRAMAIARNAPTGRPSGARGVGMADEFRARIAERQARMARRGAAGMAR
jgi:hypothetical protein